MYVRVNVYATAVVCVCRATRSTPYYGELFALYQETKQN